MKNLLLFASLFTMFFTACSNQEDLETLTSKNQSIEQTIETRELIEFCDESHFITSVDQCRTCCLNFEIDMPSAEFDYTTFETFIDGRTAFFVTPSEQNNNFQVCYEDEDGRDEMFIIFYDANWDPICRWNQSIFYEPCEEKAVSHVCWEDFIGYFKCATSMTVRLPDGSTEVLDFQNLDDTWCADNPDRPGDKCPCDASVLVPGGYDCIYNQIYAALQKTGIDFELEITDPNEEIGCFKGNDPLPGFFIYSDIQIISIEGDDCYGGDVGSALFESQGHCF